MAARGRRPTRVHTSVGATSIRRWLAPVAYQDWPDAQLPPALQRDNPWQIVRRVDAASHSVS